MNIGEYVRNKYGIAKIIDIKTNDKGIEICYFDNDIAFIFDTKLKEEKYRTHILPLANNVDTNKIKHSPNIVDLIEVGDYVNGSKVKVINNSSENPIYHFVIVDNASTTYSTIYKNEIRSILTKEQFESMEYKL